MSSVGVEAKQALFQNIFENDHLEDQEWDGRVLLKFGQRKLLQRWIELTQECVQGENLIIEILTTRIVLMFNYLA